MLLDPTRSRLAKPFGVLRRGEVGEERAQRGRIGGTAEPHRGVHERVQVGPGRTLVAARPRPHLDVQPQHPLHFHDQVGQRLADAGAQRAELFGESLQPLVPRRGVAFRRAEIVEGVKETAGLRCQVEHGLPQRVLLVHAGFRGLPAQVPAGFLGEFFSALVECDQVARAQPPARPGEDPGEPVRGGVVEPAA